MEQYLDTVSDWLSDVNVRAILKSVVVLLAGILLAKILKRKLTVKGLKAQQQMLLRRGASYLVIVLATAWALREMGFELSALLGAAGLLTIAVGFAAQTSFSNLISGLFLISEQPFQVGDLITVEGTTGEVLSVDTMSVKIRTFDNLMVRIPNETMLKTNVTNLTRFPIRRIDVKMGVAYKEDMQEVQRILIQAADANPKVLEEPRPLFIFLGFGDSSLDFQFSVWTRREDFLDVLNTVKMDIKNALDAHDVEIPFPHRTLYTGSETEPMPVKLVGQQRDETSAGGDA